MSDYERMCKKAAKKGWKTPGRMDTAEMRTAWTNYWQQCEAYERNPEAGRPVVPHRSGGQRGWMGDRSGTPFGPAD